MLTFSTVEASTFLVKAKEKLEVEVHRCPFILSLCLFFFFSSSSEQKKVEIWEKERKEEGRENA